QINTMNAVVRAFDIGVSRELVKKFIEVDDVSRQPVIAPPMEKYYDDQVFGLLCQSEDLFVGMFVLVEIQVVATFVELHKRTGMWHALLRRSALDIPLLRVRYGCRR